MGVRRRPRSGPATATPAMLQREPVCASVNSPPRVPDEDALRIRTGLAADAHDDDRLDRRQETITGGQADRSRPVDRWDPVARRAARHELGERHRAPREVGRPTLGAQRGRLMASASSDGPGQMRGTAAAAGEHRRESDDRHLPTRAHVA
jgi:hypothetical protein